MSGHIYIQVYIYIMPIVGGGGQMNPPFMREFALTVIFFGDHLRNSWQTVYTQNLLFKTDDGHVYNYIYIHTGYIKYIYIHITTLCVPQFYVWYNILHTYILQLHTSFHSLYIALCLYHNSFPKICLVQEQIMFLKRNKSYFWGYAPKRNNKN